LTAIRKIKNLKKIFLVHGEESQSLILAEKLRSEFSAKIAVPKFTEIVEI
jgi:predicted metal-dependent RNase